MNKGIVGALSAVGGAAAGLLVMGKKLGGQVAAFGVVSYDESVGKGETGWQESCDLL